MISVLFITDYNDGKDETEQEKQNAEISGKGKNGKQMK